MYVDNDPSDVLSKVCADYISFISRANNLNSYTYKLKDNTQCFGFIPKTMDMQDLIKELSAIRNHLFKSHYRKHKENYRSYLHRPSFLDIGCGIGNIILIAKCLGYSVTGLEYNPKICKVAEQLCVGTKIIQCDMRKFTKYNEYDVLYYYQPMSNYSEMEKFSVKLAKEMKPGAYLFCDGTAVGYRQSKKFRRIPKSTYLWRKAGKLY